MRIFSEGPAVPTQAASWPHVFACSLQMADAMEMMILSILAPQLHCEWRLPSWQVALLTSVGSPVALSSRAQFWSPRMVFCRMPPTSSCCCRGLSRQELNPQWNHQDLSVPSPSHVSWQVCSQL